MALATQRAAYFKGVRLWQWLQEPEPWAQRSVLHTHDGLAQTYVTYVPDNPNFSREVKVDTVVAYAAATSDLSPITSVEHVLLDVEADLIANAAGEGPLCICDDPARTAAVGGTTAGDGTAKVVAHGAAGGSWTRTVNRYVLCRNPATGAGFYSIISAVDSVGTDVTIVIPNGTTITNAWDLVDVQTVYPYASYTRMHGGAARQSNVDSAEADQWRAEVSYWFNVRGAVVMASAHVPSHDNS